MCMRFATLCARGAGVVGKRGFERGVVIVRCIVVVESWGMGLRVGCLRVDGLEHRVGVVQVHSRC